MKAALLCALLSLPASAGREAARAGFITPAVQEALAGLKAALPDHAPVNMNVYAASAGGFYQVSDPGLRISVSGSRTAGWRYYFSGSAAGSLVNLSFFPRNAQAPRQGFTAMGSQTSLWIDAYGQGFSIRGNVGRRSIWLQVLPAGSGFSIWGQMGLNLSAWGSSTSLWVNGSADRNQFDEEALAVLGSALAVLHSLP